MPPSPSSYVSPIYREGIFKDKVVFCTGGAGTICSAQVRALVHLGANAAIIGRNVEKTESMAKDIATARKGAKVIGLGNVDVRKPESLKQAAEKCVQELGGIDIAIAGAAGNFLAPILQLSENAMKSVIDIDVLGSYNTVKAVLPYLLESVERSRKSNTPGPSLLFVSADLHYTGIPLQTHVCAAKAAVDALSANCAIELGPRGIRSNVIAPGPIAGTEGMDRLLPKEEHEAAQRKVPIGRWGTVKDIADATVWLCSDAATFVNGTNIVVGGGSWRMPLGLAGGQMQYPESLLGEETVQGVKGMKKEKSKL